MGPSNIEKAVDDFLEGKWAASTKRFVYCVRASLADTALQDTIEAQAARLLQENIVFEGVDGIQLSEKLRSHLEIVDDFFGRHWLIAFAGKEAAALLKRPLEVQRVIALRKRLAEIYSARAQQLDPGLNVDPRRRGARDIRKRFVVPYVDQTNPFDEPSLEPEDRPTEAPGEDGYAWQFDDNSDPAGPAEFRRPPSEQSVMPSLALDDWLLRDDRALLLSGAPGSGKSTVLRCLALDLVRAPKLFPAVRERLGARIPLLIPFALWSRLTVRRQREVGLAEVTRELFRAFLPQSDLEESFVEALSDERLVLLIDGLDEYSDEQAARTTLATIETFVRTHDVFTIATARPAGLRRLGPMSGYWNIARLVELHPRQQRDLATKLVSEDDSAGTPVALRVKQFFQQLENSGRLQSLAGNPLLLHGLLSVAARHIILPNTRFQLFQKLIEILLEVHPNRRATAAAEVKRRTRVFSTDDVRREALGKLAFEVQVRGADDGIDRGDARQVVESFLADANGGPGWSGEQARVGARELTDVDADTSGLLVERGPEEIAFCHAAFREHLAGLQLAAWTLDDQLEFVSAHADEPRWRGAILALLQSLRRRADVERILEAIQAEQDGEPNSTDRRLLLADGAFATASASGPVGRQAALDSLSRIEFGTDDAERLELLGLALDGPRAGPIGEAIVTRIRRWWPGVTEWQPNFYAQLGRWPPTDELAQTLLSVIHGDSNQLAASSSLASVFGGCPEVGNRLIALTHKSVNHRVTAAALDALSRGWPSAEGLDQWLHEAERSPSVQLREVAALALYRRGRRGGEARDSLLRALGAGWSVFGGHLHGEIMNALVADWANDRELHDACWAVVARRGPPKHDIRYDHARSMFMRLHREDSRVTRWMQQELETSNYFPFGGTLPGNAFLEPILSEHANVRTAVEAWFEKDAFLSLEFDAARTAAMLRNDVAKRVMLNRLAENERYRFWPVWSLLHGWGMEDPEVAAALRPLARIPAEKRQYIAHHIPAIVGSVEESSRLLMEICDLPEVSRTDFVIRGFTALENEIDESEAVSAIMPHVRKSGAMFEGESALIAGFHADPRVRAFALERLRRPSPPLLVALAGVYAVDAEIAPLILQRAAPLSKVLRRFIARRASHRFDDEALRQALQQCELETDEHAMVQATIGLSHAVLAAPGEAEARTEVLRAQLHAVGPDFHQRRAAAFGGLLALGRIDVFAGAKEERNDEALSIDLVTWSRDCASVLELAAERWEELEEVTEGLPIGRLSREGDVAGFWGTFAPYLGRSPLLRRRFLEYCEDEAVVLQAPGLLALSRLKPGSSLLLECCKRVLTATIDMQSTTAFDTARTVVVASKCLAAQFSEDSSAVAAIIASTENLQSHGGALVGLASHWPDHEVVVREYQNILERQRQPGLLVCAQLWLLSAQGTSKKVSTAFARFVTRSASSPWDFPEDAADAFRARLERDPDLEEDLQQLAMENDDPSVRGSTVRLLASMSTRQSQGLAEELLAAECRRSGPPRFARDIITNRIRPARELVCDALRMSNG